MPTFAMTYVVWDPRSWTLKVGRAWRFSRVQRWIDRGWVVVVCQRGTDASWEREALAVLRHWFPAAFRSWAHAEDVLGPGGKAKENGALGGAEQGEAGKEFC